MAGAGQERDVRLSNGTYADAATVEAVMVMLRSMDDSERLLARKMAEGQDPGAAFRKRHKIKEMSVLMKNITLCAVGRNGTLQDPA